MVHHLGRRFQVQRSGMREGRRAKEWLKLGASCSEYVTRRERNRPRPLYRWSFTPNILSAKPWNALDFKRIDDIYDRFSPTHRLCIQKASDSLAVAAHERDIRRRFEFANGFAAEKPSPA